MASIGKGRSRRAETKAARKVSTMFRQQTTVAFQEGDREKVGTAGDIGVDVMRHSGEFAAFTARSKDKT